MAHQPVHVFDTPRPLRAAFASLSRIRVSSAFPVAVGVVALLAISVLFGSGSRCGGGCCMYRTDEMTAAEIRAQQFVDAHTEWSLNADDPCPRELEELTKYMNSKELNDPWGTAYAITCDEVEGVPFGVVSAGADRRFETSDDIKSWQRRRRRPG